MSVTVTVDGVPVDVEEALSRPKLNVLAAMKSKCGLGLGGVVKAFESMRDVRGEEEIFAMLDDDTTLRALRTLVWLVLAHGGLRDPAGGFYTMEAANDELDFFELAKMLHADAEQEPEDAGDAEDTAPFVAEDADAEDVLSGLS